VKGFDFDVPAMSLKMVALVVVPARNTVTVQPGYDSWNFVVDELPLTTTV
jgi:hypothetical protein